MKEIEREKRDLLIKRKTIKDAADNFLFSTLIRIEAINTDYFERPFIRMKLESD